MKLMIVGGLMALGVIFAAPAQADPVLVCDVRMVTVNDGYTVAYEWHRYCDWYETDAA
jgi:hypothetical protein